MAEMLREKQIKAKLAKLRRFCQHLPDDKKTLAFDLAERLAFLQVTLQELEADINEHGAVEQFSQSPGVSYQRERPAVRIYNQTLKNYGALIKQFASLLPPAEAPGAEDELMAFVKKAQQRPWKNAEVR